MIQCLYTGSAACDGLGADALLHLAMLADQYDVACVLHVVQGLLRSPENLAKHCVAYLHLPETLQRHPAFTPLVVDAKRVLAARFLNLDDAWLGDAWTDLTLEGVCAVLDRYT